MSKHLITEDGHKARKLYSDYSKSLKERKISPEFKERLDLSDDDRCFKVKVVGSGSLDELLYVLDKTGVKPIPGGWDKILVSAIVYATKKQILKLITMNEIKYIKFIEAEIDGGCIL
ncbi:MAG: hypothetical protein ACTSYR_04515 [Candidatus Odinarchaeia archaeon]